MSSRSDDLFFLTMRINANAEYLNRRYATEITCDCSPGLESGLKAPATIKCRYATQVSTDSFIPPLPQLLNPITAILLVSRENFFPKRLAKGLLRLPLQRSQRSLPFIR
jgi:hypothetical protein